MNKTREPRVRSCPGYSKERPRECRRGRGKLGKEELEKKKITIWKAGYRGRRLTSFSSCTRLKKEEELLGIGEDTPSIKERTPEEKEKKETSTEGAKFI